MSDRRSVLLLALLLLGQLVLLSAQVQDRSVDGSLLEASALRVSAPLAHVVAGGGGVAQRFRQALRARAYLRSENQSLRAEVAELRRERVERRDVEGQLERLLQALDYEAPASAPVGLASVVYLDHLSWLGTLLVHAPEKSAAADLLDVGSPVTTHQGLVGHVTAVRRRYARVQMITARSSGAGAMIERTRRQGVVHGSGSGNLSLDFVPLQGDVRVGDVVVTAGIDGVYPRGVPIGTVVSVVPGDELFHQIAVTPAVDFGLLDQVFILPSSAIPEELVANGARGTNGASG